LIKIKFFDYFDVNDLNIIFFDEYGILKNRFNTFTLDDGTFAFFSRFMSSPEMRVKEYFTKLKMENNMNK